MGRRTIRRIVAQEKTRTVIDDLHKQKDLHNQSESVTRTDYPDQKQNTDTIMEKWYASHSHLFHKHRHDRQGCVNYQV